MQSSLVVLASASPDRRVMFEKTVKVPLRCVASGVDERAITDTNPVALAQKLAHAKANAVWVSQNVGCTATELLVVGADSLVAFEDEVLGKPEDRDDAERILRKLEGHQHRLVTGYSVIRTVLSRQDDEKSQSAVMEPVHQVLIGVVVTTVTFRSLDERERAEYLASDAWQGKAGGYGIGEAASAFIPQIAGCFLNVVGFPFCDVQKRLVSEWGIELFSAKAVAALCTAHNYGTCGIEE